MPRHWLLIVEIIYYINIIILLLRLLLPCRHAIMRLDADVYFAP